MERKVSDIEREAGVLVDRERMQWEMSVAFVTEKIAFDIRNLVRQCRKNYYGIFDVPNDKVTGRKKTFVPMTESLVEATVKNNDLDPKDITFNAKKISSLKLVPIIRGLVNVNLDRMFFGEFLDDFIRRLSIDGTAIWKTSWDAKNDTLRVDPVDVLNLYVDPTAYDLHEAYRVTERSLMTSDEIRGMKEWINTEDLDMSEQLNPNDPMAQGSTGGTSKFRDVWESFGLYPKRLLTGKEDDDEEVEMHIVVSGLESNDCVVHLIERWNKVRPYELGWYQRVPGRLHGRGVAEKLLMLQSWLNLVVNTRINRHLVSQLGLFKIKRGSGITPQSISKLASNGGILVQSMDDIDQFVMQEASQSSYNDEANIYSWSEKVTSAFEVVTGQQLPASTTATATSIQSRSAESQFVLIKEGIGNFLERWITRQAMPLIFKNLKKGEVYRVTGDPEAMLELTKQCVEVELAKQIDDANSMGLLVDPAQMAQEVELAMQKFESMGVDRYFELKQDLQPLEYDVRVQVTNSKMDTSVLAQNLVQILSITPELRGVLLPQLFDVLGLDTLGLDKEMRKVEEQMMMQQQQEMAMSQAGMSQGAPQVPKGTEINAQANTMANAPKF